MYQPKMLLLLTGFLIAGRSVLLAGNSSTRSPNNEWILTDTKNTSTSDPSSSELMVFASLELSQNGTMSSAATTTTTTNSAIQTFEIQSSFLDSSTLEDMSSKSKIQFSGPYVPIASLFSEDGYSTTVAAESPSLVNSTVGVSNDTISQHSISWPWQSYIFGVSFAVTAILSTFSLFHFFCMAFSERIYFAISNVLLVVFCTSRCCYTFRSDVRNEEMGVTPAVILYQSSAVALTAAIMLLDGGLCLFCQVSWWKFQPLRPTVVNLFIFPYCILLTATVFLVIFLQWLGHDRALYCLVIVQKLVSNVWSVAFVIFSWLLYDRLYKASILKQGQILRATLTQLHIEGAQLPKTLPKSKLCLSVRAVCVTTILFFILNFLMAYGLFFVDHFGLAVHFHQADTTSLGLYQNALRIFEVGTCGCLAAAHYWSQSGHQCRPLLKRTNSLFELTTDLWRSSAERLRRLSEGHFRRHCIGGDHHPLERPTAAPFEIYYPSSSGITGTHFTFEKWERGCCPSAGGATCRPPEGTGSGGGTSMNPILKTFQRLSQVSPQRFQLNPVRLSAPSSSWSLSSAVVAGLKSLTPTHRRSSSSSGSSASGTPFTAVVSSWKPKEDPVNAYAVPPTNFPSRMPESVAQKRHYGHCKNSSCQRARYAAKPQRGPVVKAQALPLSRIELVRNGQLSIHGAGERLMTNRKVKLQRDGRHAEDGKRKKALMVSRATQVYIPSPDRRSLVQNYQRTEMQEGTKYSRRCSPCDCHKTEDHYGSTKYYHQVGVQNSHPAFAAVESDNLKRSWHVANSSTSCSSESAANSFDVRFYVYSASSEAASPSNSSPSRDFHDHFYPGICHSSQPSNYGCGTKNSTEHPHAQHQKGYRLVDDIMVITDPMSRLGMEEQSVDISSTPATTAVTYDNHPSLNLSLPLQDSSCTTATSDSKNLQDITPDSAVYLELNLPQSSALTPVEPYSTATPCERLPVKKCVSLMDLSRLESHEHCKWSATLQPTVSMVILHSNGPKMDDLAMISALGLSNDREGPLCAVSNHSNSDSLYDSGGSTEFLRTPNCIHNQFC